MIKNKVIAKNMSKLMLDIGSRLDRSLYEVQEKCKEEQFKVYRRAVARILTNVATEILNPLYREHPDLKPKEYYLPGLSKTKEK